MKKGRKLTLASVKQWLEELSAKSERWLLQEDAHKELINLSVSLSVIFLHHELVFDALYLLRIAVYADVRLFKSGGEHIRLWSGRLHTFSVIAYLFQNLRFLREAQSLLLAYSQRGSQANPEIAFEANFLTFFVLWKVRKYREAFRYVQMCARGIRSLRHSDRTRLTLTGLVAMSLSACQAKIDGDTPAARETLSRSRARLQSFDVMVTRLMQRLYDRLGDVEVSADSGDLFEFPPGVSSPDPALPGLPGSYLESEERPTTDFLIDGEFEKLFFIANFLSNLHQSTPLISEHELESARVHRSAVFHSQPEPILRKLTPARSASITDRSSLRRNLSHRSSLDFSSRLPKRSPSCAPALSARHMLAQGRIQLKKMKTNLKALQREAVKRRKAKENFMVQFTPQSAGGLAYEAV